MFSKMHALRYNELTYGMAPTEVFLSKDFISCRIDEECSTIFDAHILLISLNWIVFSFIYSRDEMSCLHSHNVNYKGYKQLVVTVPSMENLADISEPLIPPYEENHQ